MTVLCWWLLSCQMSSDDVPVPAENVIIDPGPVDIESDEGSLQFFISSAAADTPLTGPLHLTSPALHHGTLMAPDSPLTGPLDLSSPALHHGADSLLTETVGDGGGGSDTSLIDFTSLVSPSKVSGVHVY